jgi:hypothetical protein
MFRFFRRPPRDSFEPDIDEGASPVTSDELAEENASAERPRRPLKTILAFGIVAAGLAALYLSWSGGHGNDSAPSRLLPHGSASLIKGRPAPSTPRVATSAPSVSTDGAAPPDSSAAAAPQAERPTFHAPLPRDPRETSQLSDAEIGPYHMLAQTSHEATMENLRSQIAELKLKKLKAELEADALRKNPGRLFKEEKPSIDLKREASGLERLARVTPPSLPIQGPIPAERLAPAPTPQPAAPPAPPQMLVRMVMLEPKEAVIEAGDGDSRGWFTVREGQTFPDFVVTDIGQHGVTISARGRAFFYPVGASALGVLEGHRRSGPRQISEPSRR